MNQPASKTSVNSFGYFLESIEKDARPGTPSGGVAHSDTNSGPGCSASECDDPQLAILRALSTGDENACALDLMKQTKLAPTILLNTLRVMKEFGLVKLVESPDAAEVSTPKVHITPCGRRALELYQSK